MEMMHAPVYYIMDKLESCKLQADNTNRRKLEIKDKLET